MYTVTTPRDGLGIAPIVIAAIVAAVSQGATAAYSGYMQGRVAKSAKEAAMMYAAEEEKKRQFQKKLVIAGGIGLAFMAVILKRR